MKRVIYFVTGNEYKFQIATAAFKDSGFDLLQKNLDTPEIQSKDLGAIVSFSARWAADALGHPVFLTDAGCFIEALNGFPGPFIRYINEYLTAKDFLQLMAGKENRKVTVKDCLAYCEPGNAPVLFYSSANGTISMVPGKNGQTSMNEIFIPDGYDVPESEISREQMVDFWRSHIKNLDELVMYLNKKSSK